jgi:hypothetical protein
MYRPGTVADKPDEEMPTPVKEHVQFLCIDLYECM